MTDNRTTELLCKLLEERGIEWKNGDAAYEIEWNTPDGRHCSAMYWKPTFTVLISGCTPEQAIAVTLGNGTLTAEQVRECVQHVYHEGYSDGSVRRGAHIDETDWQAIADELNAHVGRTCEPNWVLQGETQTQEFWRCECGNCGECFGVEDRSSFPFKMTIDKVEIPNFCQKCGCKVVDE